MNKLLLLLLLPPLILCGQNNVRGKVLDDKLKPLFNATIYWIDTTIGTTTNQNGEFKNITDFINRVNPKDINKLQL